MTAEPGPSEAIQVELAEFIEDFLARQAAGESPSIESYIARRPDLEIAIRELFATMLELRSASSSTTHVVTRSLPAHLGEYRLVREIARGGMGVVYEAIQEPLGRRVALKVISEHCLREPILLARFQQEAKTAAGLHHSNIVPIFGYGDFDGTPYFAMQFLSGTTVADQVRAWRYHEQTLPQAATDVVGQTRINRSRHRGGRTPGNSAPEIGSSLGRSLDGDRTSDPPSAFPASSPAPNKADRIRLALDWVIQIGEALQYAHQLGVIHRDVKPSNILIDERNTAFLVDFGLSKLRDGHDMTATGAAIGTPRYLAPERLRGLESPLSDVYALGATLYELLGLQAAYSDEQRAVVLAKIQRGDFPPLRTVDPELPTDLDVMVGKAMAYDPKQRYASAAELVEDLRLFRSGAPIRARRLSRWAKTWRWAQRNPALAATTAGLAVSLLAGLVSTTLLWRRADILRVAAEQNAQLAAGQTRLARERLAKTLAMVQVFHNEVFDNLRFAALGFEQTRRKLLQTTLQHYLDLAAAGENQPEFQLSLAEIETAVADTQVLAGDATAAEQHYLAAIARHQQLRGASSRQNASLPLEYERSLATTLLKQCRYYHVFAADKLRQAIPVAQAQVDRWRQLAPDDHRVQHACAVLAVWSAVHVDSAEPASLPDESLLAAIDQLAALYDQAPQDAQLLMDLAEAQLGQVHDLLNAAPAMALAQLDGIQPRLESFVAEEPNIIYFRYLLAEAYRLRAWAVAALEEWSQFEALTREAERHATAVIRRYGDTIARFVQQRADIHGLRGTALYNRDRAAARREFESQLNLCRTIQTRSVLGATGYGVALRTYTSRFEQDLEPEACRAHLEDAVATLKFALGRAPNYHRARSELAAVLNNLGMLQLDANEVELAEQQFREAIEHQTAARQGAPSLPHATEFLGNHHLNLGRALLRQNQVSEGIAEFAEAACVRADRAEYQWGIARELAKLAVANPTLSAAEFAIVRQTMLGCIDRALELGDRDPSQLERVEFAEFVDDPEFQQRLERAQADPQTIDF